MELYFNRKFTVAGIEEAGTGISYRISYRYSRHTELVLDIRLKRVSAFKEPRAGREPSQCLFLIERETIILL